MVSRPAIAAAQGRQGRHPIWTVSVSFGLCLRFLRGMAASSYAGDACSASDRLSSEVRLAVRLSVYLAVRLAVWLSGCLDVWMYEMFLARSRRSAQADICPPCPSSKPLRSTDIMAEILSGALGAVGDLVQDGQVEKACPAGRVASHELGGTPRLRGRRLNRSRRDARLRLRSRPGVGRAVLSVQVALAVDGNRRSVWMRLLRALYYWPLLPL